MLFAVEILRASSKCKFGSALAKSVSSYICLDSNVALSRSAAVSAPVIFRPRTAETISCRDIGVRSSGTGKTASRRSRGLHRSARVLTRYDITPTLRKQPLWFDCFYWMAARSLSPHYSLPGLSQEIIITEGRLFLDQKVLQLFLVSGSSGRRPRGFKSRRVLGFFLLLYIILSHSLLLSFINRVS